MSANSWLNEGRTRRLLGAMTLASGMAFAGLGLADEPATPFSEKSVPLVTNDGRSFNEVTIVGVDPNGILFKHARGAGKVLFEDLSAEIQAHFGYNPEAAAAFEGRGSAARGQAPAGAVPGLENQAGPGMPIAISFRTRVTLPQQQSRQYPWSLTGCGPALANYYWPYQWGRWHPGLAYNRFPCRQAAERDFLISTGILPRPWGYRTWRYWR